LTLGGRRTPRRRQTAWELFIRQATEWDVHDCPESRRFYVYPKQPDRNGQWANVTGVNFTDTAASAAPTITTQPANQTVRRGKRRPSWWWRRDGSARLPVAEEWGECQRCDSGELHDGGDSGGGQWDDVPRGGEQRSGNRDECGGDVDSDRSDGDSSITTQPANQTVTGGRRRHSA